MSEARRTRNIAEGAVPENGGVAVDVKAELRLLAQALAQDYRERHQRDADAGVHSPGAIGRD
jgi:hypothetical protein